MGMVLQEKYISVKLKFQIEIVPFVHNLRLSFGKTVISRLVLLNWCLGL